MKRFFIVACFISLSCGQPGSQGPQGIPGTAGPTGASGTLITVVQFCPNVVPTYPTIFPESGICVDGILYAVYSANDGFLTEVPPGLYTSNAIGSACTFLVSGNCKITQGN